jgi:hypothetical protein
MKSFLIAGILFLCFGCNFSQTQNRFNGSWYACSEEGFYVELHIKNQTLKYSSIDSFVTPPFPFEFNRDTLEYLDNYTFKDSTAMRKALINFESKNCMKMYFGETNELWTWYRIEGKFEEFEADKELIFNTQKRAKKFGCFDKYQQSKKEKEFIYFQF